MLNRGWCVFFGNSRRVDKPCKWLIIWIWFRRSSSQLSDWSAEQHVREFLVSEQICVFKGCCWTMERGQRCLVQCLMFIWISSDDRGFSYQRKESVYQVNKSMFSKDNTTRPEVSRALFVVVTSRRWSSLCAHLTNYSFPYLSRTLHYHVHFPMHGCIWRKLYWKDFSLLNIVTFFWL